MAPTLRTTTLYRAEDFFFGSTNVDEGYKDDLRDTITMIDRTLKDYSGWNYEYWSSW